MILRPYQQAAVDAVYEHLRHDVDNSLKCLLDTFTYGGLYDDDSQICKLTVIKREPMPPDGMAYIRITEWNGDKTPDDSTK